MRPSEFYSPYIKTHELFSHFPSQNGVITPYAFTKQLHKRFASAKYCFDNGPAYPGEDKFNCQKWAHMVYLYAIGLQLNL